RLRLRRLVRGDGRRAVLGQADLHQSRVLHLHGVHRRARHDHPRGPGVDSGGPPGRRGSDHPESPDPEGPVALAQRAAERGNRDSGLQPEQSPDPARAGQVRAHGLRTDPGAHDDLPSAGHPARAAAAPGARRGFLMALLEARGVSKRFGGLTALNGVDFTLDEGHIASIIGPNGAGKTTFFNVFTGIYVPEEGSVTFRNSPGLGRRPDQITALGICRTFQNIRLFPWMTAIENVMIGMHSRIPLGLWDVLGRGPRWAREEAGLWTRAGELLSLVGLRDKANEQAR